MSNITKTNAIKQYTTTGPSQIKSTRNQGVIGHVQAKSNAHNSPDRSSNNQHFIIDYFYEHVHNVKASFSRVYGPDDDGQTPKQYVRSHLPELVHLMESLIEDTHDLMDASKDTDTRYGTHYFFWIEALIHDHEKALSDIGCTFEKKRLKLIPYLFRKAILEEPQRLRFLFDNDDGFIAALLHFNTKLKSFSYGSGTSGNIIDLTT